MSDTRVKVGTYTVETAREHTSYGEIAYQYTTQRIEPGTYDVYAYVRRERLSHDAFGPYYISPSYLSVRVPDALVTECNYRERVGTRCKAHMSLNSYWRVTEGPPKGFTPIPALVVREWDPDDGRRMGHYEFVEGISLANFQRLTPYGNSSSADIVMPEER